jgi:hypothetical protein
MNMYQILFSRYRSAKPKGAVSLHFALHYAIM